MKYIVKRILQAIPLLLIITFICFMLINLAPYDAIDSITTPDMTKQEIEAKREAYGLNDPVIVQYGRWLGNICRGEFGYSLRSRTSISYDLKSRIPSTIKLVLPSYLTAFLLAIVLGLVAGSHKNQWQDKLIDGICSIGIATPTFWFAMIIMFFFGYKLELFPLMGMHTIGKEDSILDFLCDGNPKILKHEDGRMWMVQITGTPSESESPHPDFPTTSFEWVEIGSAESSTMLYSNNFIDVNVEGS